MSDGRKSIWGRQLTSPASDKKIVRVANLCALVVGAVAAVFLPVLFVLNLRQRRIDYSLLYWFVISVVMVWKMRKTIWPNQTPQHNAGSRPSSDDPPASETPSSLGPRG
jgi:hypothetical protein